MQQLSVGVTVFPNVQAASQAFTLTSWPGLCDWLDQQGGYERPTIDDCPLIKLAQFGGIVSPSGSGSLRHDDNVQVIYGVEGDHDSGEMQLSDAAARLRERGVAAYLHTTRRHRPEKPRWRVLAPLSAPCLPEHRRHFVGLLNAALDGVLAPESFKVSQSFYIGRVKGATYESARV